VNPLPLTLPSPATTMNAVLLRHIPAASWLALSFVSCVAPLDDDDVTDDDDATADDDDSSDAADPGIFEFVPLADPEHVAGQPLLYDPGEVGVEVGLQGHTTRLAFDPADRWLDDFSGGFGALDCDLDGDLDLAFTNSAGANSLFLNDGTGRFVASDDAGLAFPDDVTASASVADFDADGDPDLLLLNQFQPNRLLRNDGSCGFEDVAPELGLDDEYRSLHATWFDLDRDGHLDLYLTNWGGARGDDEPGIPPEPHPDRLWLADGAGGFVDATDQLPADTAAAFGMTTAFHDFDGDGDYDLFQTNDRGAIFIGNRLFENRGFDDDGRFVFADVTVERGFVNTPDGMGLAFGDIDGDGDADILNVGNYEALFINDGGSFYEAAIARGLPAPDFYSLSWGVTFVDPASDGDLDPVYVQSGFWDDGPEDPDPYRGPMFLFMNDFDTEDRFNQQALGGLAATEQHWRAQGTFDVNGDGFEDVVTSPVESSPLVFLTNPPTDRRVVQVRLVGTRSNRDGRGAVVRLTTPTGVQTRWPGTVDSYSIGTMPWVTFGVGTAEEVGPLVVEWPSGAVQQVDTVPAGHVAILTEPEAAR